MLFSFILLVTTEPVETDVAPSEPRVASINSKCVAASLLYLGASPYSIEPGSGTVKVEIGRSPNPPGLALPSRPGKSNIRWCEGETAKRAKEQGFTLDRVLAGRRQASVHMSSEGLHLTPLHKSCPTYVLDNGKLTWVKEPQLISATDRVVAGTNVIGLRSLG